MKRSIILVAAILCAMPAVALTVPLTFDVVAGFSITNAGLSSVRMTPVAGVGVNLTVSAEFSSPGTAVALFQSDVIDMPFDGDAYTTTMHIPFDLPPGNYTVTVMASTGNETSSVDLAFEYLALAAVALDSPTLTLSGVMQGVTANLIGDTDPITLQKPTLRNVGNVPITLAIAGDTPYAGTEKVSLANVQFSVNGAYLPLKTTYQNITGTLAPNATLPLNLRLTVPPSASPGSYLGALKFNAKASS